MTSPPFSPGGPPVGFAGQLPGPLPGEPEAAAAVEAPTPEEATPTRARFAALLCPLLVVAGAVIAIVGASLTWATLSFGTTDPDPDEADDARGYGGLLLTEGRVVLVFAVGALVLAAVLYAVVVVPRRPAAAQPIAVGLVVIGFVIVATALLAVIAHPVDIATFLHTVGDLRGSRFRIPNGPGPWVAVAGGAVLIAAGGVVGWPQRLLAGHDEPAPDDDGPVVVSGAGTVAQNQWDTLDNGLPRAR